MLPFGGKVSYTLDTFRLFKIIFTAAIRWIDDKVRLIISLNKGEIASLI